MKERNLSPSQFADEIGIQRSGMSHILSGRNKPSLDFVLKILKRYPEIKPDWLLQGILAEEKEIEMDLEANGKQPSLFDLPVQEIEKVKIPELRNSKPEFKATRNIERIIIFYNDRTFREYRSEVD